MLILEDGSGLTNSNSYANVATADAHFGDRLVTAWTEAASTAKAAALIRATDYIDANYVFRSVRAKDEQSLENPRFGSAVIPAKLIDATVELALVALTTDLFAIQPPRDIVSEEKSLGKLSKKVTYSDKANTDPYPSITKLLSQIATRRGAAASSTMMTLK